MSISTQSSYIAHSGEDAAGIGVKSRVVSNNPVVPLLFNESRDFPLSFLDLNSPQNREDAMNDQRCPKCKKLMLAMTDRTGKTELRCVKCDKVDPMKTDAVKWANSGLSCPTNAA